MAGEGESKKDMEDSISFICNLDSRLAPVSVPIGLYFFSLPQNVTVIHDTEMCLRAYCCFYGTEMCLRAYCSFYGTEMCLRAYCCFYGAKMCLRAYSCFYGTEMPARLLTYASNET